MNCSDLSQIGHIVSVGLFPFQMRRSFEWPDLLIILSKGAPINLVRQGDSYTLYWADGSAVYVYTSVLRPTTPVLLVLFGVLPTDGTVHSWRGFANNLK